MQTAPAFTLIVACRNPGPQLPATIESIRAQRWVEPQIIVADLGSTDGSRAWAAAEGPRLSAVIHGSAENRVEALNQAIAAARGEWLIFLQAGDRLVGDMVLSETGNWMKKTEAGVVVGEVAWDDGSIEKLRSHVNPVARNFLPASAGFYRATLFAENGSFDPSLRWHAEYEFNVRLWKSRVRFKPIPLRIAAAHRPMARELRAWPAMREEMKVRHRYFSVLRCAPWDLAAGLRWLGGALVPRRG
jgi:glycosyltransferase involved in cell wall biosynthesis